MSEEIKERLSKNDTESPKDYFYMGSLREMSEIRADENVIRKALDGIMPEQQTQSCAIPIRFKEM